MNKEDRFTIAPIQPHQVTEARRLIYTVAHGLFITGKSLEDEILMYESQGELSDMDDIRKNYFENGGTFLVMLDGERIIGTGAVRSLRGETCELKRLWFLSEYQGRGLGYRMIQQLFEAARKMGYRRIYLETDGQAQSRALAFYRRLGFVEVPMEDAEEGDIAMERAL